MAKPALRFDNSLVSAKIDAKDLTGPITVPVTSIISIVPDPENIGGSVVLCIGGLTIRVAVPPDDLSVALDSDTL